MTLEIIGVWLAAFFTLAVFSFLYKDNPIYKFAEHLFVGASTGVTLIQTLHGTLIPNLFVPIRDAVMNRPSPDVWLGGWPRIGALILTFMLLARLYEKTSWISRWPLALLIGTFAAIRMTGLAQSDLVSQVNATMVPLRGANLPWFSWEEPSVINHTVFVVGVVSVLVYFFFSLEQKTPLKQAAQVGTVFLMITFGSSFGYTVLGRVSLLIGRAQDMYLFAEARYGYASIVCAIAVAAFLAAWEARTRKLDRARRQP